MPLEKQVTSLEPSRRLRDLGMKQESFWHWCLVAKLNEESEWQLLRGGCQGHECYDAFTVAELGAILRGEVGPTLTMKAYGDVFGFPGTGAIGDQGMLRLLTEPDRLAQMLIYLIENGLLKANPTAA